MAHQHGNGRHAANRSFAHPHEDNGVFEFVSKMTTAMRRHWLKSAVFYIGAMLLLLGLLLIVPRKYMSEGKLFVTLGRGAVTLDPTVTTNQTVHIQETRDAEINSVADILESRVVAEKVVDEVGVDRFFESNFILSKSIRLPEFELPSFSAAAPEDEMSDAGQLDYKALKHRERAMRRFENALKVKPTKKAATISVIYRAPSPRFAQQVVECLMRHYQDLHIEAHRTEGSLEFFDEQVIVQRAELESAHNALRDYKNSTGITSIEGQRAAVQMQLDQVDSSMISAESEIAGIEHRLQALQHDYDALDAQLVTESVAGNANEGADLMRDRLFNLEMQYKNLLSRFRPDHPEVKMVRDSMEQAKRVYNEQPYDRKEVKTAVNPTKLAIEERLLLTKSDLAEKTAYRDALIANRNNLTSVLEKLNQDEAQLEVLIRNAEVAKSTYRTYAEKREEARIGHELDRKLISNVKVVQPATLVVKAVSPRRMIPFLLGAVFFFFASFGLAYLLESLDSSVRTPDDLARQVDVPVLVTLPKQPSKRALTGTPR